MKTFFDHMQNDSALVDGELICVIKYLMKLNIRKDIGKTIRVYMKVKLPGVETAKVRSRVGPTPYYASIGRGSM